MQITRIALVGLSTIGRRHLRLLKQIEPDIDVILVRSCIGQSWPEQTLPIRITNNFYELTDLKIHAAIISSLLTEHVCFAQKNASVILKPLSLPL